MPESSSGSDLQPWGETTTGEASGPQLQHATDRARGTTQSGAALGRGTCLGLGLLAGATLVAAVVAHLHDLMIEDDAFVFVRYADHLLAHHTVAWNPGGPASYGTTSLLHLLLVVAVRALVGARPATVAVVASLVGGLLFLAAMAHLLWRSRLRHAPAGPFLAVLLALPLAWSAETLAAHFVTGMDTTLALSYVVLLLAVGVRFEARPTAGRATAVALVAGGTWAARPDLGRFSRRGSSSRCWFRLCGARSATSPSGSPG